MSTYPYGFGDYDAWKLASPDDGPDEECCHEEFTIDLEGRAHCERCFENWWPSDNEILHYRYMNEIFDAHMRRQERVQWWRDQWERIAGPVRRVTFPIRDPISGWLWKRGWRRSARRFMSNHDEIPF